MKESSLLASHEHFLYTKGEEIYCKLQNIQQFFMRVSRYKEHVVFFEQYNCLFVYHHFLEQMWYTIVILRDQLKLFLYLSLISV